VRANGDGFVSCQTNTDCDPINIGFDAGDCTRASSTGVNTVIALPGPLRVRLEAETEFRCASNPAFTYPGCPKGADATTAVLSRRS
jgi:hypothetical protein